MAGLTDLAVRQQRAMGPLLVAGGPAWPDRAAARGLARPAQPVRAAAAPPGQRDQPDHRRHARLLRQRRGRPRAAGARPGDHRRRRLRGQSRAPSRSRPPCRSSSASGSARTTARCKYRFVSDLPFSGPRARIRSTRSSSGALDALRADPEPAGGRGHRLAARPPGPDRDPGADGRGLRRLPQHATPTARSATGRSATCAASRRSRSRSRWAPTSSPSSICCSTSSWPPRPASPSS